MHAGFDLNLLKVLSLLLQTKNVTATARRIGSSQPSVSRALAQLRTAFKDPLLIRTSSGMELTERAEQLIGPLQHWMASTSELLLPPEFDPALLVRRFRIASTDFGVSSVIAPALSGLTRAAPGAVIEVVAFTEDMMAQLAAGRLDLIVTGIEPDPSLVHSRRLFREHFCCVVRQGHPLGAHAGCAALPLADYLNWPHVTLPVGDNGFDRIGMKLGAMAQQRRIALSLPYFQAAPELLEASDAILTLPVRLATKLAEHYELAILPAPEAIDGFDYWLLWHERSHRDRAMHWLADVLAGHCANE